MNCLKSRISGNEWHLITTIHDGANGMIFCVIDTQVYDLIHPCHVCFWLAIIDSMALLKLFCGGFSAIMLIFILMVKAYILQLNSY
jgi:hypothetical protein